MIDAIEALIKQNQEATDDNNTLLEALVSQTQKNDNKLELEAIAKANIDTKRAIKMGNNKVIDAVKEVTDAIKGIEFPEQPEQSEEVVIKNINEINKDVVSGLNDIKKELEKPQEVNITLELI